HRAGCAWAGTRTRSRGSLPRRSRSAPRMPPSGRSCLRVRQLRAGAADHQPSVCNVAETAEPDMLPDGPGRAGPIDLKTGRPVLTDVYDRAARGETVEVWPSRGTNATLMAFNPKTGLIYLNSGRSANSQCRVSLPQGPRCDYHRRWPRAGVRLR